MQRVADTRNTAVQLSRALSVTRAVVAKRPPRVAELGAALARDGEAHGFSGSILSLCDAVLVVAEQKGAAAARIKGGGPVAGDLLKEANALLGVYEQLYAAFVVAEGNGA